MSSVEVHPWTFSILYVVVSRWYSRNTVLLPTLSGFVAAIDASCDVWKPIMMVSAAQIGDTDVILSTSTPASSSM